MSRRITRVLVANRGEIAARVFHTCRELGLGTVAVYSEADVDSPHRFAADTSVCVGPAPAADSYLRVDRILEAAKQTGADAIHPGYGFLSENGEFADAVEAAGITFIGPTADHISQMGDKIRARELMAAAGVPVIPGAGEAVGSEAGLRAQAEKVGFPLLIKAAAGGGGKGIRRVDSKEELVPAWQRAASEAEASFSDSRVYVERLIVNARHIEAQVFGDGRGGALFLGERDCSLQRNHQKVLEETPSPAIDETMRARIREASLAGVSAIHYRGAGTLEYLYEESRQEFYFLEMNTRLQVEHPVTELVSGMDLVAQQLAIAEGADLEGVEEPTRRGHAMEFRVYAEDPYRGFVPSTGSIRALRLPHAPFGRVDHALREGYEVGPYYDPMLAKVCVWATDREAARVRLETLLRRVRIGGVHTSIPLGIEICRWPDFASGQFHTASLESWMAERSLCPTSPPPLAVRLAGIVARDALQMARTRAPAMAPGGGAWGATARREGVKGEP